MYLQVPSHSYTLRLRQPSTREETKLTYRNPRTIYPRRTNRASTPQHEGATLMLVFHAVPAHCRPISETVFRRQKKPRTFIQARNGKIDYRTPLHRGRGPQESNMKN